MKSYILYKYVCISDKQLGNACDPEPKIPIMLNFFLFFNLSDYLEANIHELIFYVIKVFTVEFYSDDLFRNL